jgi:hypothetical protein
MIRALLRRWQESRWDRQYHAGYKQALYQLIDGVPSDAVLATRRGDMSQRDLGISVAVYEWCDLPAHRRSLAGGSGGATLVSNECKRSSSIRKASLHEGEHSGGVGG